MASVAPLNLLLVDDELLVRTGLRLLLDGVPGISVVGEAADGQEAVALAAQLDPDVVLMDIRMPRFDGLHATEAMLRENPARRVVMLTTFDADATVLQALRLGAAGFLLKDTHPADLVDAVRRAADGQTVLAPSVTRTLVERVTQTRPPEKQDAAIRQLAQLTPRERDIASAVARGVSNQEIAEELFLGLATVKTHIARVMQKLGATNRVQIALCVYEAELPGERG